MTVYAPSWRPVRKRPPMYYPASSI
jgi:hypothetical protein